MTDGLSSHRWSSVRGNTLQKLSLADWLTLGAQANLLNTPIPKKRRILSSSEILNARSLQFHPDSPLVLSSSSIPNLAPTLALSEDLPWTEVTDFYRP